MRYLHSSKPAWLLLLMLIVCGQIIAQKTSHAHTGPIETGYAVMPFKDTLFLLHNRSGSFSAGERATAVTRRVRALGDMQGFRQDSLKLVQGEFGVDLTYGEKVLLTVSQADAAYGNLSAARLAADWRSEVTKAVVQYRQENGLRNQLWRAVLTLLVIGITFLAVWLVHRIFRFFKKKIETIKPAGMRILPFGKYRLSGTQEYTSLLLGANRLAKLVLILLVIFFALPLLFSIFPQTELLSVQLLGLIIVPVQQMAEAIWNYLPRLFTIIIIITTARYFVRAVKFFKQQIEKGAVHIPSFHEEWAEPTYQILRVLVYALVLVLIFPYLPGSGSPVFNGVTIFVGALATFGSSNSLGNIVSGLALTYMRAFKNGDRVKIGDVTGDVINKNLLVTRVRTIKNEVISIPNSNVLNNHTINFSKDAPGKGLILHTTITIGYDVSWRTVHELALKAALLTEGVERDPLPFIYQTSLDDFYVSYQVNAYTRLPNQQASIYSELHRNLLDQFHEGGIEILSPHYRSVRDGHTIAVPEENLPENYEPSSFRIRQAG